MQLHLPPVCWARPCSIADRPFQGTCTLFGLNCTIVVRVAKSYELLFKQSMVVLQVSICGESSLAQLSSAQ